MRRLAAWGTSTRRQTAWPCLALRSTEGVRLPTCLAGGLRALPGNEEHHQESCARPHLRNFH
jgi:hypothetical protein